MNITEEGKGMRGWKANWKGKRKCTRACREDFSYERERRRRILDTAVSQTAYLKVQTGCCERIGDSIILDEWRNLKEGNRTQR